MHLLTGVAHEPLFNFKLEQRPQTCALVQSLMVLIFFILYPIQKVHDVFLCVLLPLARELSVTFRGERSKHLRFHRSHGRVWGDVIVREKSSGKLCHLHWEIFSNVAALWNGIDN